MLVNKALSDMYTNERITCGMLANRIDSTRPLVCSLEMVLNSMEAFALPNPNEVMLSEVAPFISITVAARPTPTARTASINSQMVILHLLLLTASLQRRVSKPIARGSGVR